MRAFCWIAIGWMASSLFAALKSRLHVAHVFPDPIVLLLVFLALHRNPASVMLHALVFGFFLKVQSSAPMGLQEALCVTSALGVYVLSGRIVGSGRAFFAFMVGAVVCVCHVGAYVLMLLVWGNAAFSSLATAALLPNAAIAALLGYVLYPWMVRLEHRLVPPQREGLSWQ